MNKKYKDCVPAYLRTCVPAYLRTCVPAYLRTCVPAYLKKYTDNNLSVKCNLKNSNLKSSFENGFSLISTLIATLIMGILISTMLTTFSWQNKELQFIKEQLLSASLKFFMIQTMKNLENCTCHFKQDPTLRDAKSEHLGPFSIDETAGATISPINLGSFRSGCDFTSPDNVVVAAGEPLKGGANLVVDSVKVKEITPTGTPHEYQGSIQVAYQSRSWTRAMKPVSVDVIMSVDGSSGTPQARPIVGCGGVTLAAAPQETIKVSLSTNSHNTLSDNNNTSSGNTRTYQRFKCTSSPPPTTCSVSNHGIKVECPLGYHIIAIDSFPKKNRSTYTSSNIRTTSITHNTRPIFLRNLNGKKITLLVRVVLIGI